MTSSSEAGGALQRILRNAQAAPRRLLWSSVALMALPGLLTLWAAWRGTLGVNPLEHLLRSPGKWSLILLLLALAIAPARHVLLVLAQGRRAPYGKRLSDWNWLIRLRRPVGLAAFAYAALHLAAYVAFDIALDWHEFATDLREKPFIAAGSTSFVLLLPLAVTSTNGWMRRLGRHWKRLHMLVYPAVCLALLHWALLSKPGVTEPLPYAGAIAVLLGYRLLVKHFAGSRALPASDHIDGTAPERNDAAIVAVPLVCPTDHPDFRFPHLPRS